MDTKKSKVDDESHSNGHSTASHKYDHLYRHLYTVSTLGLANAVKVAPDKVTFAVATSTGAIRIYNLKTGAHVTTLTGHTRGVSDVAFSPIDSSVLALCSDDLTIRLWLVTKRKCIRILKKHTYHVTTLAFNTKGNLLISGAADETIVVWDLTTGRSLKSLAAHSDPVSCVRLTPDDTLIVSASYDGLMRLFDLSSGQCLKTLVYNSSTHGTATASTSDVVNFPISFITLSPNGRYILSLSLDGKLRLWDYMNNKVVKTYGGAVNRRYNSGSCFITASAHDLVASGSDDSGVLFWDVQTKETVFQVQPGETVLDVAVVDDGRLLLTCTLLGVINAYEMNAEYARKERVERSEEQSDEETKGEEVEEEEEEEEEEDDDNEQAREEDEEVDEDNDDGGDQEKSREGLAAPLASP